MIVMIYFNKAELLPQIDLYAEGLIFHKAKIIFEYIYHTDNIL